MAWSSIISGLSHFLYPRLCEGCSKPLLASEEVLCIACAQELPKTSYHHIPNNETALRFAGRIPFKYATSLAYFTNDGLLQHLLHGLKYKNKQKTGTYLGRSLAYDLQHTNWINEVDCIMPVPLHRKKESARGYNQSRLIAEGMSDVLHIPVTDGVLIRIRPTESQTQKTRAERIHNMQDAFDITDTTTLAGKHILLIDDVLTTGATLEACALALYRSPDITISIATIGIAS